jgi:hypothetical protein
MYILFIIFAYVSCSNVKINSEYFNHIKKMNKIYKNSENTPYPNQNFIFLENGFVNSDNIFEKYSAASGMAIASYDKTVYGLTAGHWCEFKNDPEIINYADMYGYDYEELLSNIKTKVNYYGEQYDLKILSIDTFNDLCLVSWESEYSHKIKKLAIAKNYPTLGDPIYTVSAPLSVTGPNTRLHFEGKFSGCEEDVPFCFYTIPGTFGSSGSVVLNEDGEIVGVLVVSIMTFDNVTGGSKLEAIRDFLNQNL